MREIIEMLAKVPAISDEVAVAKGKWYLPTSWKDQHRINKQMQGYG